MLWYLDSDSCPSGDSFENLDRLARLDSYNGLLEVLVDLCPAALRNNVNAVDHDRLVLLDKHELDGFIFSMLFNSLVESPRAGCDMETDEGFGVASLASGGTAPYI